MGMIEPQNLDDFGDLTEADVFKRVRWAQKGVPFDAPALARARRGRRVTRAPRR